MTPLVQRSLRASYCRLDDAVTSWISSSRRNLLDCAADRNNGDLIHIGITCEPRSDSSRDYRPVQTSS
jgi:hypothetical protein